MNRSKSKSATKKVSPAPKKAGNKNVSTVNLAQAVADPSGRYSAWAVVLDATGSYKTNDSTDYVTKLKVIDQTWNADTRDNSQMKKFVHVFVYSANPNDAPHCTRIGDVVHLKNFDCKTYAGNEVKFVWASGHSEWSLFDGRRNAPTKPSASSGKGSHLSSSDASALKGLREWNDTFWATRSVKNMNWFGRDDESVWDHTGVLECRDIDKTCIVLAATTNVVNDREYRRFAFGDENGRVYMAEYSGSAFALKGDVVKLRSVGTVTTPETRRVNFTGYSCMLGLPRNSKDWKAVEKACQNKKVSPNALESHEFEELFLDKMQVVQVGLNSWHYFTEGGRSQKPSAKKSATKSVKGFPQLDEYDHGEDDFLYENNYGFKFSSKRGSAVNKRYSNMNYSTFQELMHIQNRVNSGDENLDKYQYKKFLVRGFVLATEHDNLAQTAKLYSPTHNRVWDLDHYKQAKGAAKDLQTILHNVFYMKDQSIESEQRCFPVYLITFDENPQNIFDLWKVLPDHKKVKDWMSLDEGKSAKFTQMMDNLKAPQYFYDMVLQLMVNNQGRSYFRVCDTMFWFQN